MFFEPRSFLKLFITLRLTHCRERFLTDGLTRGFFLSKRKVVLCHSRIVAILASPLKDVSKNGAQTILNTSTGRSILSLTAQLTTAHPMRLFSYKMIPFNVAKTILVSTADSSLLSVVPRHRLIKRQPTLPAHKVFNDLPSLAVFIVANNF